MDIIWNLAIRNMKIYFRNKSTIFFSFLSMLIIIGLYTLFMGDMQINQLKVTTGSTEGLTWLVNGWIMGGIITVNAVNITLASLNVMIEDKERKYIKDFMVAPIKRSHIVISYILASIIVGSIMTLISFIFAEIYIVINGGQLLNIISTIKVIIGIIVSVIAISSMSFYVYSFVNNEKTLSVILSIVGALIGFLAGVFVPIGIMPEFIQKAIKLFPITYSATMLKGILIDDPSKLAFANTSNEVLEGYNVMMGNVLFVKGHEVSYGAMITVLLITAIIFFGLSILKISKQKNYN